jgi:flotillin
MESIIFLVAGLVLLVVLSVVGFMTRYKKALPNKILVIFGRTGNKGCQCYVAGAKFVWPVLQGYAYMSMEPLSMTCELNDALDKNNIRVNVKSEITVAISNDEAVMQNAATRLLGVPEQEIIELLKGIIYGQLRLIVSQLSVEELVSARDEFLRECETNLSEELVKLGYSLINVNISDIDDTANIIKNRGKRSEEEAKYSAEIAIQEQQKAGEIGVAAQKKDKEIKLSEIERDKQIQVSENEKQQAVKTAEIDYERSTITQQTSQKKDIDLREIEKQRNIALAEKERDEALSIRDVEKVQSIQTQELEKQETIKIAEIKKDQEISVATNEAEQKKEVAEQEKTRDVAIAQKAAERDAEIATANANKEKIKAEVEAKSKSAQESAKQESEATIEEAKQESLARQESARQKAESVKEGAKQKKEAEIAKFTSDAKQKKAIAEKDATVAENKAKVEIAKSAAILGCEQAESEKIIGQSKVESEKIVELAKAQKKEEVSIAEKKAEEKRLESTMILGSEMEAKKLKITSEGKKVAAILDAEAEAEAEIIKAKARAAAIEMEGEAEAKKKRLLAEATGKEIAAQTENIANLKRSGLGDAAIVQWALKDEMSAIVDAQSKLVSNLNLGQITVVGSSDQAGSFILDTVKKVQELSSFKHLIPGLTGVLGKLEDYDKKNENKDPEFPEVADPDPKEGKE